MSVPFNTSASAERLLEFVAWLGYTPTTRPNSAMILALQRCTPQNGVLVGNNNTVDVYNDSLLLLETLPDSSTRATAWLGTTDPGRQLRSSDIPKGGLAHITFGMHEYVKGFHKLDPKKPAFRAKDEVNRIWRDKANDGLFTQGDVVELGYFGINIHPGGKAVDHIGDYSQGCMNIFAGQSDVWGSSNWTSFRDSGYRYLPTAESTIQVCVWRFPDLESWLAAPESARPTLVAGIKGPWVAYMQQCLKKKGYSLLVDGDWMNQTTEILKKFQAAHRLTADAICGPATWKALGG